MTDQRVVECTHVGKKISLQFEMPYVEDRRVFMAEISIVCECGTEFQFKGLPAGMSFNEPRVSVDGKKLLAPVQPYDGRIAMSAQYDMSKPQ